MACRAVWTPTIGRGLNLLLLLLLFATLLVLYKLNQSPLVNQYAILHDYLERNQPEQLLSTRSILLWNDFFGNRRWYLPADTLGPQDFRDIFHCPVYQCELTNNHDFLPAPELYDAIVYHMAEPFPIFNSIPAKRSPHQLYVFGLMEPPGETKHKLSDEQDFYNLTMTYRLDSDIVWSYGQLIDKETHVYITPNRESQWRQPPGVWNDSQVWQVWSKKSKMAVWLVSHCETLSQREKLAKGLQQFIQVDIYGKCGPLSCLQGDPHCKDMLDTDYKFYLSFENALCTDYVTEKLFGALEHNIIPVVFGGANYSYFMPPRSYIDANHFDSVAELAKYLEYVASDVNVYMTYFWWRKFYELGRKSPFCQLCAQLHSPSWRHKRQVYGDIESWWFNSCNFKPNIEYARD